MIIETENEEVHNILSSPQGHGEIISSHSETTGDAGPIPFPDSTTDTTYSPRLYIGPFVRWCEGETWLTPSVTETIVSDPGGTTSRPTDSWEGVVETVDGSETTPAGTFAVVRSKTTLVSGPNTGGWTRQTISMELGVLIKEEIFAPNGELIGSLEAISID